MKRVKKRGEGDERRGPGSNIDDHRATKRAQNVDKIPRSRKVLASLLPHIHRVTFIIGLCMRP